MLDNYVTAKTSKRATWKTIFIVSSVVIHAVVIIALLIRSFWVIEKLNPPENQLSVAVSPPPPPPPPPPPAGKQKPTNTENKKRIVKDTVQPTDKKVDEEVTTDVDTEGVVGGEEGGVIGGQIGGVSGGSLEGVVGGIAGGAPPPPPPPKKEPKIVPQVALEQQRIAGDKRIVPDDETKLQIRRSGTNRIVATVKMCLTGGGGVSSLHMQKSSGYPAYDRKIQAKMRQWKYRPFKVNGKPVPVCTAVTFIYNQKD